MSKSIKFKNNIYLDTTGIAHNKHILSDMIDNNFNAEDVSNYFTLSDTTNFTLNAVKAFRYGKVVFVHIALTTKVQLAVSGLKNWKILNVNHSLIGTYNKMLNVIIRNNTYVPQANAALTYLDLGNNTLTCVFNSSVPANYYLAIYGAYIIS